MRNWLRISVAINIFFILFFIGKRYYYSLPAGQILEGMTTDSMNNMGIRRLNRVHIKKGDIVFIGTSITEGLPIQQFASERIKNFGIGWNQTAQIMNRLDSIAGKPSKIFIEAGINDIRGGVNMDSILHNYKMIIEKLKGSEIFVQSVFPVSGGFSNLQSQVNELNEKLKTLCKIEGTTYIDVDKKFGPGLTVDGLHPNPDGYNVWISEIDSLVK